MINQSNFQVIGFKRKPWNEGKVIGQKPPLQPEHVSAIRSKLQNNGRVRDLALFNLAIDSNLRGCDLVSLKVEDVAPYGYAVDNATLGQKKSGRAVEFAICEMTRKSIDDHLRGTAKVPGDYLFAGRRGKERCLTTRQYARLVYQWIESIGLDASLYGTHSLARTSATSDQSAGEAEAASDPASGAHQNDTKREPAPEFRIVAAPKTNNQRAAKNSGKTPKLEKNTKAETSQQKGEAAFSIRARLILGMLVIGVLVVFGGGWAGTAQLTGAIIAQGMVVVEQHLKKVQHFDGGIVAEINVSDGDVVESGEILIRLDDTRDRAELSVVQSQIVELTGRQARLSAERDGLTTINFSAGFDTTGPGTNRVRTGETRLFESNRKAREGTKKQLRLRIGQHREEIKALASQRDAKVDELKLIRKELEQVQTLYDKKFVEVTRLYKLQREATRIDGERGGLEAQMARALAQISEIRLQILAVDQTTNRDSQREIREIEGKIAELAERKVVIVDRLSRVELRAPVSGVVHELAVHTIGGVVAPGQSVMLIVPGNEDLTIEARIMPNDIDQIGSSQDVRVRLSAFSQRATSELRGQVVNVAADVTEDARSGQNYYLARIEIDDESLREMAEDDFDWKLVPGMPVEVFITTGNRTALSYLAKPITDQLARAFRDE